MAYSVINTPVAHTEGTVYTTTEGLPFVVVSSTPAETGFYTKLHLGGGVIYALISEAWNGIEPVLATVEGTQVRPKTANDSTDCGYLLPDVTKASGYVAGDMAGLYWRGQR
jgi:hypothetical protein